MFFKKSRLKFLSELRFIPELFKGIILKKFFKGQFPNDIVIWLYISSAKDEEITQWSEQLMKKIKKYIFLSFILCLIALFNFAFLLILRGQPLGAWVKFLLILNTVFIIICFVLVLLFGQIKNAMKKHYAGGK